MVTTPASLPLKTRRPRASPSSTPTGAVTNNSEWKWGKLETTQVGQICPSQVGHAGASQSYRPTGHQVIKNVLDRAYPGDRARPFRNSG